jgi:ribonuclease PH
MNVVMTGAGKFIEIQGTAEHGPFDRSQLGELLDLAAKGNRELQELQRKALAED